MVQSPTAVRLSQARSVGSLYVRKDFKILRVDVAAPPDHIDQPPYARADAAFTLAAVMMTCWTGN